MPLTDAERALLDQVSGAGLMEYTGTIASRVRLSGSPEEAEAFDYIQRTLAGFGLPTERHDHDAYISWPGPATFQVLGPGGRSLECITYAFATPAMGLEGPLVYLGKGDESGSPEVDLRGKIILSDGMATRERTMWAEQQGVLAHVNIDSEDFIERIVSPLWGSPTHESRQLLPRLPGFSIKRPDGEWLKARAAAGEVRVRLDSEVRTGWWKIPLLTVDLPGSEEPEDFVLVSGHVDSWHYGAMDNGTANACQMEVARLFAQNRGLMRRSLRVAFWSGHSHGRYAGSQWYADNFFGDLREHCVAHVNVDSLGGRGATRLMDAPVMAETRDLAAEIVEAVSGQQILGARMPRAGDQSFNGVGVPALFIAISRFPPGANLVAFDKPVEVADKGSIPKGNRAPWWHTVHDTFDKIDEGILVRDTRAYVATVARLLTAPILPLNYVALAAEFSREIGRLQAAAGGQVDFGPTLARVERLAAAVAALDERGREAVGSGDRDAIAAVNRTLKRLGRHLIPVDYTKIGPFDHDLSISQPPFPLLAPAARLGKLDPESDEAKFTRVAVRRGLNAVNTALEESIREVEGTLAR